MRRNIFGMRQRKIDLFESAKAQLAAVGSRDMNPAEKANYDKTTQALAESEREIVIEEQRMAADSGELLPDENAAFAAMARGEVPADDPRTQAMRTAPGRAKYSDLFGRPRKGAFQSFGQYVRAVAHSDQLFDPRLKMAAGEDIPSGGGFMVPEEFSAQVFDQSLEGEIVRPRAVVVPMTSETRKWPAVQDDDHSGGSGGTGSLFGGMAAGWSGELQTLDLADMKTRLIQLTANKFGLLQNSSNELLEDSVFEATLSSKFQAGAAWHLDNAFLFGEGTGKPLGALNSANHALVVVPKESGQAAGTFLYENAVNMFSTMAPACVNRAVWLFSSTLVPQLLKMQLVVKNVAGTENVGGSATPVLTVAPDGSMTLLTRPVVTTEKLQASGLQGDAAFVDFTQYVIGQRRELRLERSGHAGFQTDSTWFRLTARVDGQPLWARAQKLLNGETVSPFVTLAAR